MTLDLVQSPLATCDIGLVPECPPLGDLQRRELCLLVACKEASLAVSSQLTRGAALGEALYFAARQTFDDARHLERFRRRDAHANDAAVPPELGEFFARCLAFAEAGAHFEALALLNLAFKGTACAFHGFAARYWRSADARFAQLLTDLAADETVHVDRAVQLVRGVRDEASHADLVHLCADASATLDRVFVELIGTFVRRFRLAARQRREHFATAELAHGRLLLDVSEEEQTGFIHARCGEARARILARAGLA